MDKHTTRVLLGWLQVYMSRLKDGAGPSPVSFHTKEIVSVLFPDCIGRVIVKTMIDSANRVDKGTFVHIRSLILLGTTFGFSLMYGAHKLPDL